MLQDKIKEVLQAVLPISLIVLILHFFFVPLSGEQLSLFAIGAVFVLFGLAIFLLGVDVSINQMGYILGQGLTKRKNILLLIAGGLIIGFIVSIAEPSLTILGGQIEEMSQAVFGQMQVIIVVSIGVAVFLAIGMLRIAFRWNISLIMTLFYGAIFIMSFFVEEAIISFAFDSSGATTGALTVPFILALSSGMAALGSGTDSEEYNFGLVGISSVGPIVAMLILGVFFDGNLSGNFVPENITNIPIVNIVIQELNSSIWQVIVGVIPIVIIFFLYHFVFEKQSKQILKDISFGLSYLSIGLIIFLAGVSIGFMPISQYLGAELFENYSTFWVILIGFILGVVAILAEPAIYVLINQIEDITGGAISKKIVLATIALGVGLAIAITVYRVVTPDLRLWHILLPGYLITLGLSWVVPKLFVGMGFDSGGVASGPMTGTFIFAFIQGIAIASPTANPVIDAFGMIALVAMVPILFIEILGLVYLIVERKQED